MSAQPGSSGASGASDLKQRATARIPLRLQFFDQMLERRLVVGQRLQRRLPDASEKLPKRGIAGKISAQDHGTQEESDQALELRVIATRGDTAHENVFLA